MLSSFKSKLYSYLRKAEAYTKTDMVYLASAGTWITIGNIVSSLSSLLLVIAFGNLFPPESYGIYQYVLSIVSILATPTLSGMNTALIQAVARGFDGSVIEGLKTKIRWGLLGGLGSILVALYYYSQDNLILATSFLIAGVFLPFMDSLTVYSSYLEGKKLFKKSTWYSSIINIVRTIAMVGVLFLTKNILLVLFTYFVSTTLLRALIMYLSTREIRNNHSIDASAISYGKHLSAMRILGTISSSLDKILLFHYLGAVQLAVYSFALAPISKISGVLSPITSLAMPKFAETNPELLQKTLPRKLFYFFFISAGITVLYIILAPFLYKLFLPLYLDSVLYSQAIALTLLFYPQKILATVLTAHKEKKALYIITTVSPIVKIVSLFILLPLFGMWGAIASLLLPLILNGVLTLYYFKKMS